MTLLLDGGEGGWNSCVIILLINSSIPNVIELIQITIKYVLGI